MSKNKTYIPKLSFRETIEYSNKLLFFINEFLKNKYSIINLDLPILTSLEDNAYNNIQKSRTIDFDNINDSNIYELINHFDNLIIYWMWNMDLKENECVFSKYSYIERDQKINNVFSMQKNIIAYHFEIHEENRNIDFLVEQANFFINAINYGISQLSNIFKGKFIFDNLKVHDVLKIKKSYPFLSLKESIDRFVSFHKMVLINNVANEFLRSSVILKNNANSYDWENTIALYCYDDNLYLALELMVISISPNWKIFNSQKTFYGEKIIDNDFIDNLKSDNHPPILIVKINYDLLLYLILKKDNINELNMVNYKYNLNKIYKFYKKGNKNEK